MAFFSGTEFCYGDEVDCDTDSSICGTKLYEVPPCYKVTFEGVYDCINFYCTDAVDSEANGDHYVGGTCGEGSVTFIPSAGSVMWEDNSHFGCTGDCGTSGSCEDGRKCEPPYYSPCVSGESGFGGSASWSPEWDCKQCCNCGSENCSVSVEGNTDPMVYPDERCCGGSTQTRPVTFICSDPNAIGKANANDDEIDAVTVDYPKGCTGSSITFTIRTQPATSGGKVTLSATFTLPNGKQCSDSKEIEIKPECACCPDEVTNCMKLGDV